MFDGVVLGVDPGTAAVGLAAVAGGRKPSILWAGTFRTPSGLPKAARLLRIARAVGEAIDEHHPEVVAMERLMWGRNTDSAMEVSRSSGAIMVAAAGRGLTVEEYAPLEVKMAVTGVGNASKEAVRRSLSRVLGLDDVPTGPDAADAVAVALCHLQQATLRRLTRAAGAAR
jgi:crossover junction endodeoxyribonuclease RuvC